MANKKRRAELHTTVDAGLMQGLRDYTAKQGTSKYGKFIEEALRDFLDKHGVDYKTEEPTGGQQEQSK